MLQILPQASDSQLVRPFEQDRASAGNSLELMTQTQGTLPFWWGRRVRWREEGSVSRRAMVQRKAKAKPMKPAELAAWAKKQQPDYRAQALGTLAVVALAVVLAAAFGGTRIERDTRQPIAFTHAHTDARPHLWTC